MDIADIANDYEECGVEIPEARQKAVQGCTLCIACAEVREVMVRARR